MTALLLIAAGYLVGSIPWGVWVVRLVKREDIRRQGSGNIGASNVWRTYGRSLGLPVALLDVAKGLVPAAIGAAVAGELVGVLAGGAAMAGHWRPLFLRFARGGKTVATAAGALLGVAPLVALLAIAVWGAVFLLTRYASVASIASALAAPAAALALRSEWPVVAFVAGAGLAVVVLHRPNIRRLRSGTESRFRWGRKREPAAGR